MNQAALASSGRTELLLQAWELKRGGEHAALLALLEPVADSELIAEPELAMLLLYVYTVTARSQSAERVLDLIRERCLSSGDDGLKRRFLQFEANRHAGRGRVRKAQESYLQLGRLARATGDQLAQCSADLGVGITHAMRCEFEQALVAYSRALSLAPYVASGRLLNPAHHNMAMAYRELGWFDQAQRHFDAAAPLARGAQLASLDIERAELMFDMGEVRVAEALARRGTERFAEYGSTRGQTEGFRLQAKALIKSGDLEGARAQLLRARELLPSGEPNLEGEIWEETAVLERLAGNEAAAAAAVAAAERAFLSMESPLRVQRMAARLARLELDQE